MNQAIWVVANAVASMDKYEAAVLQEHLELVSEDMDDELNGSLVESLYHAILDFYSKMVSYFSPGPSLEAVVARCVLATDRLTQLAERHGIPHTMPV